MAMVYNMSVNSFGCIRGVIQGDASVPAAQPFGPGRAAENQV
jgi:hypothetical protein